MPKPSHRFADLAESRTDLAHDHADGDEHEPTTAGAAARKPYQRPLVQKRRSMAQATLISSGGTSGTLTSGGP